MSSGFPCPPNNTTEMTFQPINNTSEAPGRFSTLGWPVSLLMGKTHAYVILLYLVVQAQFPQSKAEFIFDQIRQNSPSEITVLCPKCQSAG